MSDMVDVAIVGAGPYGLSVAAHLRAADADYRHFGMPMHLWQAAMPKGMFLKSQGFASNLSDPAGTHTLEAFCQATGRPYANYGLPVPLDTFVSYGQWFASGLGLPIEEVPVTDLAQRDGGFELNAGGVERVLARNVIIAIGVEHFAYVAEPLSGLPRRCARTARRTRTWRPSPAGTSSSSGPASRRWSSFVAQGVIDLGHALPGVVDVALQFAQRLRPITRAPSYITESPESFQAMFS